MTKTSRNTNVAVTASATTARARSARAKAVLTTAQKLKVALDSSVEKSTKQKAKVASSKPVATADVSLTPSSTKSATVMTMLRTGDGATLEAMQQATGWQAHSVRGFLSGTVKKRMALSLTSQRGDDGVRRYRIADTTASAAAKA